MATLSLVCTYFPFRQADSHNSDPFKERTARKAALFSLLLFNVGSKINRTILVNNNFFLKKKFVGCCERGNCFCGGVGCV